MSRQLTKRQKQVFHSPVVKPKREKKTEAELLTGKTVQELGEIQRDLREDFYRRRARAQGESQTSK